MGGVNLSEESKNILASNADFIGTQIRSCKDEAFLYHCPLLGRITAIGKHEHVVKNSFALCPLYVSASALLFHMNISCEKIFPWEPTFFTL